MKAWLRAEQRVKTPGIIYLTERFYENDPGSSRPFVDWINFDGNRADGFGELDFTHALANSSNVYFYKVGGGYQDEIPEGLGICRLGAYARALGYGDAPGILLPDEQDGLIPDPYWKRVFRGESWSSGDTYLASVGQGTFLTTPSRCCSLLQLLPMMANSCSPPWSAKCWMVKAM
jgi:penicillin-binding protein 2